MDIRPEQATDQDDVEQIHRAAFAGDGPVVAGLVRSLRTLIDSEQGLSLVAVIDGRPVGHLMLTPSLLDAPSRLVVVQVLSPVGVLPSRQGRGVGSSLVRTALQIMSDRGVPVVFLEGDPAYYSRLGFVAGDSLGYRRPSLRIPPAAFQAMNLPAHEPWMTGTLVYSHIFWDHDSVGLRGR